LAASRSESQFPWQAGVPAALAAAVHATSLKGPFVYDDGITVLANPSLRPGADWLEVLLAERFRPLTNVSYAIDHALWGFAPFGYHLTSVLLHALNAALLFVLARQWERDGLKQTGMPWAAASLFAVHPLLTQAVSYVSGRSELLCATFFMLGVLAARRAVVQPAKRWLTASLVCLVLALASKEVGALMPLAALAYLLLRFDSAEVRQRAVRWLAPMLGLVAVGGIARASVFFLVQAPTPPRPIWENLQLQAQVFWKYVALLLVPVGQSVVHPFSAITAVVEPLSVLAAAGIVAAGVAAFRFRKQQPGLAFGLAWFALALVPSSAIPLNEPMAEHRTYVASIGALLGLASALAPLFGKAPGRGVLTLACAALAGLTVARNQVWADERRLWTEAALRAPSVWAAQYQLGEAHRAAKDCKSAIAPYQRAVELLPTETRAHLNLGVCLATEGRPGAAYRVFWQAAQLEPKNPGPVTNLGTLALMMGNPATARGLYFRAAELEPANAERRLRAESIPNAPDTRPWPPPMD
jgi:protein O-mannosyl-transferase